jgi:hypothetical protein
MNAEYISIADACTLLDVSRPTFDSYRKKHGIKDYRKKGRVFFRTVDILERLYLPQELTAPKLSFTVVDDFNVEAAEVAPGVFDIRRIGTIDPYGAICLLCCLMGQIRRGGDVFLLVGRNTASFNLQSMNFFHELKRSHAEHVHYDAALLEDVSPDQAGIIIPLHFIGYKGGEKRILDEIYAGLRRQGFSEDLCAALGWTLGELADNTATHAGGVPCYFMLSSMIGRGPSKFLTLTIGDVGEGIPSTLKTNARYHDMSDYVALINAFKSDVSSWSDEHKRGKGLNDLLGVAKGNGAWVRAESNRQGVLFDFQGKTDRIDHDTAGTLEQGTRFCMVLIDDAFEYVSKATIDSILDDYLETQ